MRDAPGVAGKLRRHTGHAVIEARPDRDEEIAVIDGVVGERRAVHAQHAHRERVGGVERPDPHERGHDRHVEGGGELGERARGIAVDHAAPGVDQRPARFAEHRKEALCRRRIERGLRELPHPAPVAEYRQQPLAEENALPVLYVLRDVDDHGPGPAGAGDLEGRAYRGLELHRIGNQEDMLGNRAHDRGNRRLLEGIGANRGGGHLTRNHDNRYRISHAIAHGCNSVRRTGPGSHEAQPHPARGPGIARGHEPGPLLVGRDDERNLRTARAGAFLVIEEHRVVGREDRPAAVAEYGCDALVGEHLHDHAGAGHFFARERVPHRARLHT